ncbi:MAG: hypothetical protein LHV69_11680, partial [Elusimicrobia bacterium]|nr:hypothetical protein [Candidatus Obscuribacterium magneticum]
DTLITPLVEPIIFRRTTLKVAVSSMASVLGVDTVEKFPAAPGRLVFEDNTANREVVTYTGVDPVTQEFTGVIRGVEGTTAKAHSTGAKVDGQAYLQILGPYNGQEITKYLQFKPQTVLMTDMNTSTGPLTVTVLNTIEFPPTGTLQIGAELGATYTGKTATTFTGVRRPTPIAHVASEAVLGPGRNKSYFISYDIDPLAIPGRLAKQQTVLGLNIPATSYVTVLAPDVVDTVPSFNAEIGDVLEFGDTVTVVATETVTGLTLQQGAVNQPVLMLTLKTSQSEAFWTGLTVTSSGTATPADVKLVKLWRDADNNGIFTTTFDVLLASGTFGNAGDPRKAQLSFAADEQLLVTAVRSLTQNISQRFFLTYDIEPLATPETTLSAHIAATADFSLTATPPNMDQISPTGIPYSSQARTLIPSPRVVTVLPTPLISNQQGVSEAPTLDVNVGTTDTVIPLRPNTLSLPTSGYIVLDSEVIYYPSKTNGALHNVQRGHFGTVAQGHLSGVRVGSYYTQGDLNTGFMKLIVSCNGFNVRWFYLKLNRFLPPGSVRGSDQDVKRIRIWRDNGNGLLDRDPATGQIPPGTEIQIGEKALGTGTDAGGSALIALNDPTVGNPGFALITAVPTTYWITVDVDPTALYDDLLGLRIQSKSSVIIGALTPNDGIHSVADGGMPIDSAVFLIRPTIDILKIFVEDMAPPQIAQAALNVPMARINLKTNTNTAVWSKLRVDLTSDNGAVSGDISLLRIIRDVNNDGLFTTAETSKTADGVYVNLLSQGTEVFNDKVAELILTPQVISAESINNAGQNYFLTYDINPFAQVGVNVGARVGATSYFTIGYPDLVTFLSQTPPIDTSRTNILEAVDKVTLSVDDIARTLANLGGTYQAARNVPVLRFTLTTDVSQAQWTSIRVERLGASADPAYPYGHNADVKLVKVWRDANFNDQLDSSDELLSGGTEQFSLTDENDRVERVNLVSPVLLSPTPRSFFISYDIGDGAEAGASVGLKIGDLSWVSVSPPNEVNPYVKKLTFGATQQSYPYVSSLVSINAIRVTVAGQSLSPAQIPQLSTGVPVMMFTMRTDRNFVTLRNVTLRQTGTISSTIDGQGDVSCVSIWRDNGNTIFEPASDTLLGSILHAATTDFVNGKAIVTLNGSSGTVINMSDTNFYVTVDVGATSLTGKSTRGHTFSLNINGFGGFGFVPATAGSDPSNDFDSLVSNLTLILDEGAAIVSPVSLLPVLWADPYGDGYPALDVNGEPAPRTFDEKGVP